MPEQPASTLALFTRATRIKTLPLTLVPVLLGAFLARDHGASLSLGWLLVSLVAAAGLHLAAMAFNDVFDARTGADRIAGMDRSGVVTASGLIDSGTSPATLVAIGLGTTAISAAAVLVLTFRWQGAVWLAIAGAALGVGYVAPPVKLGYRGRGAGQLTLLLAFGLLPVAAGYGVQAEQLDARAWWAGLVPGLLTAVAYTVHDLLHHKADRSVGKMTPAAAWGPSVGLLVILTMMVAAYAGLVLQVAVGLFGPLALLGVLPGVPLAAAWSRAFADVNPQRALNLLGAALGASVATQAAIVVGVLV